MSGNLFNLAPPIEDAINAETDMFGRDNFRDGLINLFKNSASPLVVALDEPWGTGKTVFAKRLQNKINEEDAFQAIYFDAFENDHEEDVFIAIASEFLSILEPSKKAEAVKDKAKKVGKVLSRVLLKSGVRLATGGLVRGGDFSEANEEIANDISEQIEAELDQLIDQRLVDFTKDKDTFKSFRLALAEYASDKPIIFIIDELDRCRPDYALSVLETIKHFFSVKNVHFFLVSNSKSLTASVEHQYGDIDGFSYLQKFISLRLNFPTLTDSENESYIRLYVKKCVESVGIKITDHRLLELMERFLIKRFIEDNYSLRTIEKITFLTIIALSFPNNNSLKLAPIIAVLIDLKLTDHMLYNKAQNGDLEFSDLVKRYKFDPKVTPNSKLKDFYGMWWKYCLDNPQGEEWEQLGKGFWDYDLREPREIVLLTIGRVLDALPT